MRLDNPTPGASGAPSTADIIISKTGTTFYAKNGTTGSTVASGVEICAVIQSAATALATTGGVIYIKKNPSPSVNPGGVPPHWSNNISVDYDMNSGATIDIPEGVSIDSDGVVLDVRTRNDVIFRWNNSVGYYDTAHYRTFIKGVMFYGAIANANTKAILVKNWLWNFIIDNCYAQGVNYPVELYGPVYRATVRDCVFGFGTTGILLSNNSGYPNATKIIGNDIGTFTTAISGGGTPIFISHNYLEGNTTAIAVEMCTIVSNYISTGTVGIAFTSSGARVTNNHFNLTTGTGIVFTGSTLCNTIANNYFVINGANGIDITNDNNSPIVTGNVVELSNNGHFVTGKLLDGTITGNRIQGGNQAAILLSACANSNIDSNDFYSCTLGMDLTGVNNCAITGNSFANCTADLTTASGTGSTLTGNSFKNTCSIAGTFRKAGNPSATTVIPDALYYLASAAASPPTLSQDGEILIWRDTTNNKSYIMIRANGATVKIECV